MLSSRLEGSPDWLEDIIKFGRENPFFQHSCHKTDPKADGFTGSKKKRECAGHVRMIMNELDQTPGRGGVYESHTHLVETYLRHWLGEKEFETIKGERS